jgi:hypothetical protein
MAERQVDPRCQCGAPHSDPLHVVDHQFRLVGPDTLRLPYKVPRAPEWVYDPSLITAEVSPAEEDRVIEEMIERSSRHSLDGFDPLVGGAW